MLGCKSYIRHIELADFCCLSAKYKIENSYYTSIPYWKNKTQKREFVFMLEIWFIRLYQFYFPLYHVMIH